MGLRQPIFLPPTGVGNAHLNLRARGSAVFQPPEKQLNNGELHSRIFPILTLLASRIQYIKQLFYVRNLVSER